MKKNLLLLIVVIAAAFGNNSYSQWSLSGNAATTANFLGTTSNVSLRVRTNNVQRMIVDSLGRVGIGTPTPVNILTVKGAGSIPATAWVSAGAPLFVGYGETTVGNSDYILSMASSTSNARPVFIGRRGRGTLAVPTVVANNDYLMSFLSSGYDGTGFQNPAAIDFYVDGTPTAGNVPARISFVTGTNGATRAERLKIGSTGDVIVNNTQLTVAAATGNVAVGLGNFSVAKNSSLKGIVGINSDTVSGTALYVKATSLLDGIRVADPVNKYILYASKSGTGQGIYVTKTNATSTNGCITGVGTNYNIGIEGYGSKGNGVFAQNDTIGAALYATSAKSIGVYGTTGNALSYAGYFNGDVYSSGLYQTSDARLKTNISDFGNAMQLINALQPKSYDFKKEGNYALLQLPQGNHYGLIAQELEKVLPNLVKESSVEVKAPRSADGLNIGNATSTTVSFKAVNYTELIPIMIKGMQEQEATIAKQQTQLQQQAEQISTLIALVEKLHPTAKNIGSVRLENAATLDQNVPNPPVSNATTIGYNIPLNATKATLVITDIYGKQVKQIQLNNTGKGQLKINTEGLSAGTYVYTLFINGKMTESKKMEVVL